MQQSNPPIHLHPRDALLQCGNWVRSVPESSIFFLELPVDESQEHQYVAPTLRQAVERTVWRRLCAPVRLTLDAAVKKPDQNWDMIFGLVKGRKILWFFKVLSDTVIGRLGIWRMRLWHFAWHHVSEELNEEG